MASYTAELDKVNNIIIVVVTEDDGSDHDYQFDFDPRSGRFEFAERDLLERDFGEEWVDEMEGGTGGDAGASDGACIVWDLWVEEDDVGDWVFCGGGCW